jgi:hypothetical protein
MKRNRLSLPCALSIGALSAMLAFGVGCKQASKGSEEARSATPSASQPSDEQISNDIQNKLQAEQALAGQNIQVAVANGIATLNGVAANDASRALAAADSGSVAGVKTVINNLTVAPPATAAQAPRPAYRPAPAPPSQQMGQMEAPPPAQAPPPPAQTAPPEAVQTVTPPPPPAAPVVKTVTIHPGTVIPVRMTDTLDSGSTQTDSVFHGSLAADLIVDGMVAAPRGASIVGRVVSAKDAGHFSGSSELVIELTKLYANDQEVALVTDQYSKQGAGRGKNTAVKTGAGAVLGGLIGAIAGGGKGAAIGAATGGGIGAGTNGITRGQQVQIPSESIVNFRLQSAVSIKTSRVASGSPSSSPDNGPQLKRPDSQNQ